VTRCEVRAARRRAELCEEAVRDGDRRDDLPVRKLARRLARRELDERDLLRHLVDHRLDVEAMPADGDDLRQSLLVDPGDARLFVRVAGDEADEQRDHDRIREQRDEQELRPSQHRQVLAQQNGDGAHPTAASTVAPTTRPC
jgi:hypothetical protein